MDLDMAALNLKATIGFYGLTIKKHPAPNSIGYSKKKGPCYGALMEGNCGGDVIMKEWGGSWSFLQLPSTCLNIKRLLGFLPIPKPICPYFQTGAGKNRQGGNFGIKGGTVNLPFFVKPIKRDSVRDLSVKMFARDYGREHCGVENVDHQHQFSALKSPFEVVQGPAIQYREGISGIFQPIVEAGKNGRVESCGLFPYPRSGIFSWHIISPFGIFDFLPVLCWSQRGDSLPVAGRILSSRNNFDRGHFRYRIFPILVSDRKSTRLN